MRQLVAAFFFERRDTRKVRSFSRGSPRESGDKSPHSKFLLPFGVRQLVAAFFFERLGTRKVCSFSRGSPRESGDKSPHSKKISLNLECGNLLPLSFSSDSTRPRSVVFREGRRAKAAINRRTPKFHSLDARDLHQRPWRYWPSTRTHDLPWNSRYPPRNGAGVRKACCSKRLMAPYHEMYCVMKRISVKKATKGTAARRDIQRKMKCRGFSRRLASPTAQPVNNRAGYIKVTNTRPGSHSVSRGTISILNR